MTDYGVCTKYVCESRRFLFPPPCPECNKEKEIDGMFKGYVNDIMYVSDYVTHRVGYHKKSPNTVYYDLRDILNREEYATTDCHHEYFGDKCCESKWYRKDLQYQINLLREQMHNIEISLAKLRSKID